MKKYQWCLSITVVVFSILGGGLWYTTPLRALVTVVSWSFGVPTPNLQVDVQRVYVPSKGGKVQLQTDHYFPEGADLNKAQLPTVLMRTPYGLDIHQGMLGFLGQLNAYTFAAQGYNVIYQNCRGRYNSSGEYNPIVNEREDGFATLAWIKQQAWFNGKLGTAGPSYVGYTQFALFGSDAPIKIQAAIPTVSSPDFYNVVHTKDAPVLDVLLPWNFLMEIHSKQFPKFPELYVDFFHFEMKTGSKMFNVSLHAPIKEADNVHYGVNIPQYDEMLLKYKEGDEYWTSRNATKYLADVDAGVVHVVGSWYDMFLRDTFRTYERLVKLGKKPYLTINTGHHGSPEAVFFAIDSLAWLNYKLKGDKSQIRSKAVAYVINPTKEWVELDSWPPVTTDFNFYLHTGGKIADAPLAEGSQETYAYTFDPLDPTPILAGNTLVKGGAVDNFEFLVNRKNSHNDILLFYGSPFSKDTVITGSPRVSLWVSSSIPHADFYVRLLDLSPKNVSINICDGFLRLTDAKNKPTEIQIELDPTAYKIQQGHTVMLEIASGAHPHFARNPGTGEHLSIATEFVKGDRQLSVSSVHPSRIILPVVQ